MNIHTFWEVLLSSVAREYGVEDSLMHSAPSRRIQGRTRLFREEPMRDLFRNRFLCVDTFGYIHINVQASIYICVYSYICVRTILTIPMVGFLIVAEILYYHTCNLYVILHITTHMQVFCCMYIPIFIFYTHIHVFTCYIHIIHMHVHGFIYTYI